MKKKKPAGADARHNQKAYSHRIAASSDFASNSLGLAVGIATEGDNTHVFLIDYEPEARYEIINGPNVKLEGLTKLSDRGDYLLRCADEIVIDSDCTGLNVRQRRHQRSIIDAIYELSEKTINTRVRHGLGTPETRKLSGKQRAIEAAKYAHKLKRQALQRKLQQSLRQLANDSAGEEAA